MLVYGFIGSSNGIYITSPWRWRNINFVTRKMAHVTWEIAALLWNKNKWNISKDSTKCSWLSCSSTTFYTYKNCIVIFHWCAITNFLLFIIELLYLCLRLFLYSIICVVWHYDKTLNVLTSVHLLSPVITTILTRSLINTSDVIARLIIWLVNLYRNMS